MKSEQGTKESESKIIKSAAAWAFPIICSSSCLLLKDDSAVFQPGSSTSETASRPQSQHRQEFLVVFRFNGDFHHLHLRDHLDN